MLFLMMMVMVSAILSSLVMTLAWFLSMKTTFNREKSSPFECGFDPLTSARVPFSLRFFLVAIIFLIFDVEIVLLFPIIKSMTHSLYFNTTFNGWLFLFILLTGLLYEWKEGSLEWIKT
uniref:NADH-ubiquinone oxidoreductase chain 3 n=1 Tax=Nierstraszella lineata TaxID=515354 RepID=A0A6H1PG25_9MOLL|nr:NADH dehydrogenase subunit 3 [Nierstraszella lineata]QIZ12579.1 NADH dehydrogenase subunit 3 [Nierstraszella lineata]